MTETEVKYPYLPEGQTIHFVPSGNEFMERAKVLAGKATDQQHPTGAVVVKDGVIIGEGHNWAPISISKFLVRTHKKWCLRRLFNAPSGQKYWLCPGCTPNKDHAEARAVRDAKKRGYDGKGADLYLWGHWWCCKPCWDAMLDGGIERVYLVEEAHSLFNR